MKNKFPATKEEIARLIFNRLIEKNYDVFEGHRAEIENTIFDVLDEFEVGKIKDP